MSNGITVILEFYVETGPSKMCHDSITNFTYSDVLAVFTTHYTFGTRFGTKSGTKSGAKSSTKFFTHFLQNNFLKQLSLQNNALRTHDNGK